MSQHEGILAAIQEAPEDDTPRVVYADWLDENGEPERAEFIRAQCQLNEMDVDDPRRPELERRERQLWARHGRAWSKPLRPFSRKFEFKRGFLMHPFWLVEHHGLCSTSPYVDRTARSWPSTALWCWQSPLRLAPLRPSLSRRGYVVPQASCLFGTGPTQSPATHAAVGDSWVG